MSSRKTYLNNTFLYNVNSNNFKENLTIRSIKYYININMMNI